MIQEQKPSLVIKEIAVQERRNYQDDFLEFEVVRSTGPWMLTDSLKEHLHLRSRSGGEYIRSTGELVHIDKYTRPQALNEVRLVT